MEVSLNGLRRRTQFTFFILVILCTCLANPLLALQLVRSVLVDILGGRLEISARNASTQVRLISVRLNDRNLKEFETDYGDILELLATHTDSTTTYVVLRTHLGSGACGGSHVYLLTIRDPATLDVSPVLRECLGDRPNIRFENGAVLVGPYYSFGGSWDRREGSW